MLNQIVQKLSESGNWIDIVFVILILYFVLTQKGLINTLLETISFIFSLVVSYKLYLTFGTLLRSRFTLSKGISDAGGFFIAWFLAELIFSVLVIPFVSKLFKKVQKHPINIYLGVIAAIAEAIAIFLFFVSFIFAFPVRGQIKQAILDSHSGPFFVSISSSFEKQIKNIFGDAVTETLNFITVKPSSNERLELGFVRTNNQLSFDSQSEAIMFDKVNTERTKVGRKPLVFDTQLRDLARQYAMEMFTHGFFSHESAVDDTTPADRADRAQISYQVIGENLAYAPDVYVAHEGLMNSEGHRKNILSEDYGKVGIGVVDGGVYGKMFVQEFTN